VQVIFIPKPPFTQGQTHGACPAEKLSLFWFQYSTPRGTLQCGQWHNLQKIIIFVTLFVHFLRQKDTKQAAASHKGSSQSDARCA
ncbi:MAG: hypothetical protein RSC36_05490, partial [Ruthenibacterium sp.]